MCLLYFVDGKKRKLMYQMAFRVYYDQLVQKQTICTRSQPGDDVKDMVHILGDINSVNFSMHHL